MKQREKIKEALRLLSEIDLEKFIDEEELDYDLVESSAMIGKCEEELESLLEL